MDIEKDITNSNNDYKLCLQKVNRHKLLYLIAAIILGIIITIIVIISTTFYSNEKGKKDYRHHFLSSA